MSDDPLTKLEADVHLLIEALSKAAAAPAAAEALQLASKLEQNIGRTARAFSARQAAELAAKRGAETRSAVAEAERRVAQLEQQALEEKSARRITQLEREVEALLSPSPGAAQAFYETTTRELDAALLAARGRRSDLEARLSPAVAGAEASSQSEMERSRAAALAGAARDEENALTAERAAITSKLAKLRAR